MAEGGSPFALSASEEKEFAAMEAGLDAPAPDDLDEIAEREPDAAADLAAEEAPETDEAERWKAERRVPFKAFDAERKRARAAEQEKAQYLQERAVLQERVNAMMAAFQGRQQAEQPAAPAEETPPDPDTDIFAYAKWQAKKLAEQEAAIKQTQAQFQQQQMQRQVAETHMAAENHFRAEKPDYDDAVNHLKTIRFNQLSAFMPPEQAAQQVAKEAFEFVAGAIQRRMNPAQAAYDYAIRSGYTPKQARAAAAEAAADVPRDEAGRFVAQRDPKLDQVAAAQARSKSLSNTAGAAGKVDLTVDRLAKMSDKEFKAFLAKDEDNEAFFKAVNGR